LITVLVCHFYILRVNSGRCKLNGEENSTSGVWPATCTTPFLTKGGSMRVVAAGVLVIGLVTGGCNRTAAAGVATDGSGLVADNSGAGRAIATAGAVDGPPHSRAKEITIPAGTSLPVVLDTAVSSATSRVEMPVQAHLSGPVVVGGQPVLAEGSRISGIVTDATRSAKVKGRAHVALQFESLTPRGSDERYAIETTAVGRTAPGTKKKDAVTIGAPAVGGAIVGGLLGGTKGAVIGGAAGGGAGTAVVLSTRGKEVTLAKGTRLTLRLVKPVTIRARS